MKHYQMLCNIINGFHWEGWIIEQACDRRPLDHREETVFNFLLEKQLNDYKEKQKDRTQITCKETEETERNK